MNTTQNLQKELREEFEITQQFLALFPEGEKLFSPHEKSMNLMHLASHLSEIFEWPGFIIQSTGIDFAKEEYQPAILETKEELLQKMEKEFSMSDLILGQIADDRLLERWQMKMADEVLADWNKYEAIRHSIHQIVHHRAQLGVYYRMLNIPLPQSYGPTADDPSV